MWYINDRIEGIVLRRKVEDFFRIKVKINEENGVYILEDRF